MQEVKVSRIIVQPTTSEHDARYPRSLCNTPQKNRIFELLTAPEDINDALIIARRTGNSPVTVYEPILREAIESNDIQPLSNHEKQFVGTVTCTIMELNGFKKTDKKQNFSNGLFKKAELYEPVA
ncbi:TPA: hypothetical protein ACX3DX_004554 [Vibrio parahaemolyticus]|nr:hypothetical protein [Vibrio parahaemolyticus]